MRGYICNLCRQAIRGEAHPVRIGVPVPVGTDIHLCTECRAKLEAPAGERPPAPGEAVRFGGWVGQYGVGGNPDPVFSMLEVK